MEIVLGFILLISPLIYIAQLMNRQPKQYRDWLDKTYPPKED